MTRATQFVFVWVLAFPMALVWAQPDESLADLLEELDKRTAQIEDLTARFTQEKHSILLREPLVSKGRVSVRKDKVKWETRAPHASVLLVSDRSARLFDPQAGRVEVYPLSAGLAAIIGSPMPRFDRLRESFLIERLPSDSESKEIVLRLSPRDKKLAEHIRSITVRIDPEIPAATALEMVDAEGDRTVITFSRIKLNQALDDEDFDLDLPDDVVIEYPMGPIPEKDGA
jgi:outer membrane lipoprotein carrier protein